MDQTYLRPLYLAYCRHIASGSDGCHWQIDPFGIRGLPEIGRHVILACSRHRRTVRTLRGSGEKVPRFRKVLMGDPDPVVQHVRTDLFTGRRSGQPVRTSAAIERRREGIQKVRRKGPGNFMEARDSQALRHHRVRILNRHDRARVHGSAVSDSRAYV